jgi:hypothetical protein
MWLALIILFGSPIAISVESKELCLAMAEANIEYWQDTKQGAQMMYMQVYEI